MGRGMAAFLPDNISSIAFPDKDFAVRESRLGTINVGRISRIPNLPI